MSTKRRNLVPGALLLSGAVLSLLLVSPPAQAGEVMTLMPAEDRDVPEGSQIPEWRITETEAKVQAYKAKMREAAAVAEEQESQPQAETPKP